MRGSKLSARLRAKRKEARGLVLWIARGLVVGLFGLGASAAAQLAGGRPDPAVLPQAEPPVEVSNEEPEARDQRMLRQAVFCDRNVQCNLETAASALKSGDVHQAVGRLQQVLDQPGDHFIWVESERRLSSARRRAVSLLSAADGKTREFYDWAHAGEAQRLLDRGLKASDPAAVAEVARRFFHTAAGFDATNWLATRWLDRGEYALSIRAWKLLAADPSHRKRLNAAIQQKLGVAERLCGGGSLNDRYAVTGPSAPDVTASNPNETRSADHSAPPRSADLTALEEGAATDQPPTGP
ncbi:MAG TPA: hypothetical protein VFG04_04560, partial [Planctomycetaceae bacterium]|nr:hypothetical protein [Planctomycetaceae bacterium]